MKQLLSALIFSAVFLGAHAQIQGNTVPATPADSITPNAMNWQNIVTGSGGLLFNHHYIYQAAGDTVFTAAPTHSTNQTTFWWPLNGLQPATHYTFASVFKQGANYDTSAYRTFITDSLPGPPAQFTIAYTGITASPVGTRVQVHYASPDYPIGIKLYTDQYNASSAVLIVQGIGDTAIQAPSNAPNSTHTTNALYATTVAPIMGVSDTFVTVPDYTVPGYTPTDILSSGLSGVGQDSLRAVFSFARGNVPGATYQLWAYDSTMTAIASVPATGYAQDTLVYFSLHSLPAATKYYFKARTSGIIGADSSMFSTYTSPVNHPAIVTTSSSATSTSTAMLVVTVNAGGTGWMNNTLVKSSYVDAAGITRIMTDSSNLGTATDTFYLVNLKPGPTSNDVLIEATNTGGTVSQWVSVVALQPVQPNEPQWGTLVGKNSSTITIANISYSVSPGDTGTLLYRRMQDGSGTWITFSGPGNLTPTSFTSISFDDNGLLGGIKYYYQIGMRSKSGAEVWNPDLSHWETTIAPIPGSISEMNLSFPDAATVTAHVVGNGNGTLSTLIVELYKMVTGGAVFVSYGSGPLSVGTGNFDETMMFGNLESFTSYEVRAQVTGPGGSNPSDEWKRSFTTGFTAIDEIAAEKGTLPDTTIVTVITMIGQVMVQEVSYDQARNALPEGIYLITPVCEESRMRFGTKKVFLQK